MCRQLLDIVKFSRYPVNLKGNIIQKSVPYGTMSQRRKHKKLKDINELGNVVEHGTILAIYMDDTLPQGRVNPRRKEEGKGWLTKN